jgi:hypothetical protein
MMKYMISAAAVHKMRSLSESFLMGLETSGMIVEKPLMKPEKIPKFSSTL